MQARFEFIPVVSSFLNSRQYKNDNNFITLAVAEGRSPLF